MKGPRRYSISLYIHNELWVQIHRYSICVQHSFQIMYPDSLSSMHNSSAPPCYHSIVDAVYVHIELLLVSECVSAAHWLIMPIISGSEIIHKFLEPQYIQHSASFTFMESVGALSKIGCSGRIAPVTVLSPSYCSSRGLHSCHSSKTNAIKQTSTSFGVTSKHVV